MIRKVMAQPWRAALALLLAAAAASAAGIAAQPGKPLILRDHYGIPHIYARSEAEAIYALGYAQAEDALESILKTCLEARGRSAELDGSLAQDILVRRLRFEETAREAYPKLRADAKELLDAFVAGIRAYMREHPAEKPPWAADISATDILAIAQLAAMAFDLNLPRKPPAPAAARSGDGSNWFALAPWRTATGAPILSIDPHLRWQGGMRWYEAHVKARRLNSAGAMLIGNPMVTLGHNQHFAWSMTIASPTSTTVLYEEKLNPDNPNQYWDGTKWVEMRVVKEAFKSAKPGEPAERTEEFRYTRNGPVLEINRGTNRAVVARYGSWQMADGAVQILEMNRASTLEEFRRAIARLALPKVNLLYADVRGNISYQLSARAPIRPEKAGPLLEGWTPQQAWQGVLPFERLPYILNPKAGYLQSGNDAAWYVSAPGTLRPEDYPAYLGGMART